MKRKNVVIISILGFFIGSSMLCLYVFHWERRPPIFEIYFFYLNRGHSVFIRTPHGKTILIDGGQNSAVIGELTKVFPFYRRHLDLVFTTSALAKDSGGLSDVLRRYDVGKIIEPKLMGTSTAREAFERIAVQKHIQIERVQKGDSFEIDMVKFRILFPDPDFRYTKSSLPELVLEIDYKDSSLVLLGEISTAIQKKLSSELGHVHLIEFSHGATKSRVSADLLQKLRPEVIVSSKREKTLRFEFR